MERLSLNNGPGVLFSKRLYHSNRGFSSSTFCKSFPRIEIQAKLMRLACSCRQISVSRSPRSLIAHSYARDAVISVRPDADTVSKPIPGFAPEPFGTRNFRDEYLWSALEIAEAVGGEVVRWGPSGTISTDTRTLLPGQWFFAISGEHSDGHDFVNEALASEKGCVGVIGNRVFQYWKNGFIKVDGCCNAALEKMAKFARNRFRGIVVGLTGSVGKTTTRIMIALALGSLGRIYQTCGNLNSMVGVALTLIGSPLDAKAAVIELGMSSKGEILRKARICCPSVRVILNVGHCHLEYLHSLTNVAKAKGELLEELVPGDICVLNADDPLVMSIPIPLGARKVLFGRGVGCDVRLVLAESVEGGRAIRLIIENHISTSFDRLGTSTKMTSEMVEFKMHGPGLHLAMNACAAAAVAVSLGVPLTQTAESLSRFHPAPMRSQILTTMSGITVINDAYNAQPPSMIAAINSLKAMDCRGKRVCILGDMLELGVTHAVMHEQVLKLCSDDSIELIMLVGGKFLAAAKKLKLWDKLDVFCMPDAESLAENVLEFLAPGDVVLVKGSGGMGMGKIVSAIY